MRLQNAPVRWALFGSCILWGASFVISVDMLVDASVDMSVTTRSSIDRVSVDTRPRYWPTVSRILAVCRSTRRPICVLTDMVVISLTLGRYLINTLPIVYRYLTDTQSTHDQSMIWNQYEGDLVRRKAYFDSEFSFLLTLRECYTKF